MIDIYELFRQESAELIDRARQVAPAAPVCLPHRVSTEYQQPACYKTGCKHPMSCEEHPRLTLVEAIPVGAPRVQPFILEMSGLVMYYQDALVILSDGTEYPWPAYFQHKVYSAAVKQVSLDFQHRFLRIQEAERLVFLKELERKSGTWASSLKKWRRSIRSSWSMKKTGKPIA